MNRPLVLYHGPACVDGFTAAWCAWQCFHDTAEYVPVQYGDPPPDVHGRAVYLLDFSWPRPALVEMARRATGVVVLDHHLSAWKELTGLDVPGLTCIFDLEKSGAVLAWEYFHPQTPIPFLVRLVQDRDLWKWQLPYSQELSAYLATLPRTFEGWSALAQDFPVQSALEQGRAVLRYQNQQVDTLVKHAHEVVIDGHRVLAVNTRFLIPETAGRLAQDRPFGATFFVDSQGKKVWSLRSTPEGIDVSLVALRHGGGGHRHAAGFTEEEGAA